MILITKTSDQTRQRGRIKVHIHVLVQCTSSTAVCIGLYTRYQYIFYLGTCTFVHGSLLYTPEYAYICNYSGMYVELVYMYDHHNWARLPILLAVS